MLSRSTDLQARSSVALNLAGYIFPVKESERIQKLRYKPWQKKFSPSKQKPSDQSPKGFLCFLDCLEKFREVEVGLTCRLGYHLVHYAARAIRIRPIPDAIVVAAFEVRLD